MTYYKYINSNFVSLEKRYIRAWEGNVVNGVYPVCVFGEMLVMVYQLQPYSILEDRGTVHILWHKRLNCTKIHREFTVVTGKHAV